MKNIDVSAFRDFLTLFTAEELSAEFQIAGSFFAGIVRELQIADDGTVSITFTWTCMVQRTKFGDDIAEDYGPAGRPMVLPNSHLVIYPREINIPNLKGDSPHTLIIRSQGKVSESYFITSAPLEKARVELLLPLCT